MTPDDIRLIVEEKKAELIELDKECNTVIKQFKARKVSLQSQIEIFESVLK